MITFSFRLLGGFDVQAGHRPVRGFESRKARAVLAYILLERGRGELSRDHLVSLFWPEWNDEMGRRNLRQVLYNLRRTLSSSAGSDEAPVLTVTRNGVAVAPDAPVWVDATAFEEAVAVGLSGGRCVDAERLAQGCRLYRGRLLDGLALDLGSELEEWLLFRQEGMRERALKALRALTSYHTDQGEYPLALEFARRWVELDPLAEDGHREVMRLCFRSGMRSRALAQFEHCRHLLGVEMGVSPLRETVALYEEIKQAEQGDESPGVEDGGGAPMLAMVGRRHEFGLLRRAWEAALAGATRMTLITGEEGVGKSRLARSSLHESSVRSSALVVAARASSGAVPMPYGVVTAVVRAVQRGGEEFRGLLEDGMNRGDFGALGWLLDPAAAPAGAGGVAAPGHRADLVESLARLLRELGQSGKAAGRSTVRPVIVFVDDMQWADEASIQVLESALKLVAGTPLWLLCAASTGLPLMDGEASWDERVQRLRRWADEEIGLGALKVSSIGNLVEGFYEGEDGGALAARLHEVSGGVPLVLAEWINLLCDEGVLRFSQGGRWVARTDLARWWPTAPDSMEELAHRRLAMLPPSTRRLLILAAVMGTWFEAEVLAEAESEHPVVVETGLGVLLERRLVRPALAAWFESRRERDLTLWQQGARKGTFEFAHRAIQRQVYGGLAPDRRRQLHRDVAEVLERRYGVAPGWWLAQIIRHWLAGEDWERAVVLLDRLAEWSIALGADEAVAGCCELAALALGRLEGEAATAAKRRRLAVQSRARLREASRRRRAAGRSSRRPPAS